MPTKKPAPKKATRKQEFTPAQITAVANTVEAHAAKIHAVAALMKTLGVKSMPVDGGSKVGDAMIGLEAFIANARYSLDRSGNSK